MDKLKHVLLRLDRRLHVLATWNGNQAALVGILRIAGGAPVAAASQEWAWGDGALALEGHSCCWS